jgi:multiple sugar transport system permease protein
MINLFKTKEVNESAALGGSGRRRRLGLRPEARMGYLLYLPAGLVLLLLVGYPASYALYQSLFDKVLVVRDAPFVGLQNYIKVASLSEFWPVWRFTAVYTATCVFFKLVLGMATALMLHEPLRGRGLMRGLILLPWALPTLSTAVIWRWLFSDTFNVVNYVLLKSGLISTSIPWLYGVFYAPITLILANVWRGFPFFTITLLAGLQPIPEDRYDAAKVDGANVFQRFWHVTLPGVAPVLAITTLLSTIWTFNDFDLPWLLTRGGPGYATTNLPVLAYLTGLTGRYSISQAVSIGVMSTPILIVLILLLSRYLALREAEE